MLLASVGAAVRERRLSVVGMGRLPLGLAAITLAALACANSDERGIVDAASDTTNESVLEVGHEDREVLSADAPERPEPASEGGWQYEIPGRGVYFDAPLSIESISMDGELAATVWHVYTGLESTKSSEDWTERIRSACLAPVWEASAAEALAIQFIEDEGGQPDAPAPHPYFEGRDVRETAGWALWDMARSPGGCRRSFPVGAQLVENWLNQTGLLAHDLTLWDERVARACELAAEEDADWTALARDFVSEDGGDPDEMSVVRGALDSLRAMTGPPWACPWPGGWFSR